MVISALGLFEALRTKLPFPGRMCLQQWHVCYGSNQRLLHWIWGPTLKTKYVLGTVHVSKPVTGKIIISRGLLNIDIYTHRQKLLSTLIREASLCVVSAQGTENEWQLGAQSPPRHSSLSLGPRELPGRGNRKIVRARREEGLKNTLGAHDMDIVTHSHSICDCLCWTCARLGLSPVNGGMQRGSWPRPLPI